ncbi:MAG: hypothetical protein ABR597_10840 [Bacteroidales bacterium]
MEEYIYNDLIGQDIYRTRRENEGNFLISFAAMAKIGSNISFVFDSFIVPRTGTNSNGYERYGIAIFLPGLRFQTNPNSAFQFGFAGVRAEGETLSLPIPMVQWFRKL